MQKHVQYEKNQIVDTICQLRFPPILRIERDEPVEYQETICGTYPNYNVNVERAVNPQTGNTKTVNNYCFRTSKNDYIVNLTRSFISLQTTNYTNWNDFTGKLDEPLGVFLQSYKPAYFERIGLRYRNAFSRSKLELTDYEWPELISSTYTEMLNNVPEGRKVIQACTDIIFGLEDGIVAKIHTGPGIVKKNVRVGNQQHAIGDGEVKFIFDIDVFKEGNISITDSVDVLYDIHDKANELFSEAISDELHNAMEPYYDA